MKCLVSGATGFIGRELCVRLQAGGATVVALSCQGKTLPNGQPTIAVDLSCESIDSQLFEGVDVVFHLAGIAHQSAHPALYESVNHQATLKVAALAAAAGVASFIFLSSVKAMGPPRGSEVRAETDCYPPEDAYGQSKRRAELGLEAAYADSAMSVVILRPALVYGAGARGNLELLAGAVRSGLPRPPDIGARSMVALADLVTLMQRLAPESSPGTRTWIVCDGQAYAACRIHDLMRVALGRSAQRSHLPAWVWRLVCTLRDVLNAAPRGTSYDKIFGSELYTSAALSETLNWRPELSLADSVRGIMAPELLAVEQEG